MRISPAKTFFLTAKTLLILASALHKFSPAEGKIMNILASHNASAILYRDKTLAAAKCRKCGAKMHPASLLKPHLNRHQRKELWFATELRKLQDRFGRMSKIA